MGKDGGALDTVLHRRLAGDKSSDGFHTGRFGGLTSRLSSVLRWAAYPGPGPLGWMFEGHILLMVNGKPRTT